MFIPLKVTTDYTLMKSMIQIPSLVKYLKENNINACGICDTNLFGSLEFYDTLKNNDIKPIIGLEVNIDDYKIYLYAKNYEGYKSLLKVNTMIEKNNIILNNINYNDLKVVLPYKYIDKYDYLNNIVNNIYIGYTTNYEKNNAYLKSENVLFIPDIKVLDVNDNYYLNILESISLNTSIKNIEIIDYSKNSYNYYNNDNLDIDLFIKDIDITIPKDKRYIPKYNEYESSNYLENLAYKGLLKRLNNKHDLEYEKRLKYELDVINKMGYADYFLIVYDYVKYAKKNKICVGIGRGSAVGSLVSYCLGITGIDPLKYNLLFERFLNPSRISMPDIDIDFDDIRRDEVISYVKEKYGKECVSNIITFGTLKSKLALRSVFKSLDIELEEFLKQIDAQASLKDNLKNKKILEYVDKYPLVKKAYDTSLKIEGLKRNTSIHAAGIVISSERLDDIIPIHYNDDLLVSGLTMNYLEELGLLKMDFLAIKNLSIVSKILNLIKENTNKDINLYNIDVEDSKVLDEFGKGNTLGIFQFESPGMTNFLKRLKPNSFKDLYAANAMFRPGPMDNIDTFIKRKYGREKITYLDPDLEDILKDTYGIIIYQEQVMQILVKIGGFSLALADNIRKAISKKKEQEIIKYKDLFINSSINNGYSKDVSEKIYDLILKFASYGFNKSHSVSYSHIGMEMMYLKYYYSIYFICVFLNMFINTSKEGYYLNLAHHYNITLLSPSINNSSKEYIIKGNSLLAPLSIIKGLSNNIIDNILSVRKEGEFSDFYSFVARCYGFINKESLILLIKSSALDIFSDNHIMLIKNIDNALRYAEISMGGKIDVLKPEMEYFKDTSDHGLEEMEVFGFRISNHPSSKYSDSSFMKLENIKSNFNKYVKVAVLIEKVNEVKTKNNTTMYFINGSDETGSAKFVIFPNSVKRVAKEKEFVIIDGKVQRRYNEYLINVNKIEGVVNE